MFSRVFLENILLLFSNLDTYFGYLISLWNTSYSNLFHRKITEHPRTIINQMCMSWIITFIIRLAIDSRETTKNTLLCHTFDISIYGSSTDFWLFDANLIKNIISGKMSTSTGITDDITILMSSHMSLLWEKFSGKQLEDFSMNYQQLSGRF